MVNYYIKKTTTLTDWGKVFFSTASLKYYPPKFVLRDPIKQGVSKAFKNGYEVAVIVYHIENIHEIHQQLEPSPYQQYIKTLKIAFLNAVKTRQHAENILSIHDYDQNSVTLFVRMDRTLDCVAEIEATIKSILHNVQVYMSDKGADVQLIFNTGFMFLEKKYISIQESIYQAHQQAVIMAMKQKESEFNKMVYALSNIVEKKDIRLLAQPILDVETNEVRACEMLTRGPIGTPLESPLNLFSFARQTKFLYDLEMIVLEKTLEQIKRTKWQQDIFINFTPLTIGNPCFVKDLKGLMKKYKDIASNKLIIEVTERDSFEGLEYFISNLKILRTLGFRIAVDDTGAGYASLNSISEIMPDIIKIDRSVIQDIDKNSVKESMLKGLLLIAKEVGSIVVAEGIESAEEASVLSRNKVDLAQGYFYARPTSLSNNLQAL
ncbi:EAL domain-containing protein [Niallia sp. 03190]|uniref:EAL domain-containing protein n=1 Tax=Niallia sp. 03190 TaxID=3458061 RepID=UPI004044588F